MGGTAIVLTVICIAAIFILRAAGTPESSFKSGLLELVAVLPLPGMALGLALLLALLIVNLARRARSQRN